MKKIGASILTGRLYYSRLLVTAALAGTFISVQAQDCDTNLFPGGRPYFDTYHEYAFKISEWKHFNTHDPTVYKDGEWYYCYSTDASWAGIHHTGALKRRSGDLVNWEFLGTAFNGVPQSAQDFFKSTYNPDYTDHGIWAPFLFKHKDQFILYYSAPGGLQDVNLAYIGYAASNSANGPWEDRGMITTSVPGDYINAIDPSVVYDSITRKLWMAYGSWHSGIYVLELDTLTGGIKTPGDRGTRIANRASAARGLEGPELCTRNGWYYLFVSYDPLGTIYNVRVGRSRHPNGPYYDFNGMNMTNYSDNFPMIFSPYRFMNHPGWQGTGHNAVFNDNGKYYFFSQGRPGIEPAMMVLHVREMFWIDDWPVVSPERYAGVPGCPIVADSLAGRWEHMPLVYQSSEFTNYWSTSNYLQISVDGTFNENPSNTWILDGDTLRFYRANGDVQKLVLSWGWDWENDCKTLLYTGLDTKGQAVWGKKINERAVENHNILIDGATYTIRNAFSNMLLHVPGSVDAEGVSVRQGADNGLESQMWTIRDAGSGYHYILPEFSENNMSLEVRNSSNINSADIQLGTLDGTDKQQFRILPLGNGLFRILTKVSNNLRCLDLNNFSVAEGANIFQWEYLGGLNQKWRFSRVDTIELDTTRINVSDDQLLLNGSRKVLVFPNPLVDGRLIVDVSALNNFGKIDISIVSTNGMTVHKASVSGQSVYELDLALPAGIYLLKIDSHSIQHIEKLVVRQGIREI